MSAYESETQYLYNDAEPDVIASTFNCHRKEEFIRLVKENPEAKMLHEPRCPEDEMSISFPKNWLRIRTPRRFTDEEREVMRQRGRELYERFLAKQGTNILNENEDDTIEDDASPDDFAEV